MDRQARYFTRPELLIVLTVLALLLAMVVPGVVKANEKWRRVNCAGQLKSINLSLLMYSGDYGGFFPNINRDDLGSGSDRFGNWQPLGSMQYVADRDNRIWTCPSVAEEKSDADYSNYRYFGSGRRDDNDNAAEVTIGYDASGNHPENAWMNAFFIDGHVEGARPDGSRQVTIIERFPDTPEQPTRTTQSFWNRNDW